MDILKKVLFISTALFSFIPETVGMELGEKEKPKNRCLSSPSPKNLCSKDSAIQELKDLYYEDNDISEYIDYFFKNGNITYFNGYTYLLTSQRNDLSVTPIIDIQDNNSYFVAVSNAIDTRGLNLQQDLGTGGHATSINLDYFLDKTTRPEDTKEEIFGKLLKFKSRFHDNYYGELLQIIQNIKEEKKCELDYVEEVISGIEDKETIRVKFQEEIKKIQEVKKDVFDEFMPYFLQVPGDSYAKILFPYNITQSHWLTGEIRIHRSAHEYNIKIYAHNPYGKGKMEEEQFVKLETSIRKRIGKYHPEANIQSIQNLESPYKPRQIDSISCGVIAAEDLLKRITGTLIGELPYTLGAKELRKSHLETVEKANPQALFISRNLPKLTFITENNLETVFNKRIINKSTDSSQPNSDVLSSSKFTQTPIINTDLKFKKEKEEDLNHLIEIYNLCSNFTDDSTEIKNTFNSIGLLAKKISHNIASNECIRNKYSTVNAYNNKRILCPKGINLVELKHLSDLPADKSFLETTMLTSHFQEIKKDFDGIKNKLLYVFFQEKSNLEKDNELSQKLERICKDKNKPSDLGKELTFIPKLSRLQYDRLILSAIGDELNLFNKNVKDFKSREDRYYWGRILVKVGELLHPDELSDSYGILEAFRPITSLRATLVHSHRLLINMEEKHQEVFYNHAKSLFETLNPVLELLLGRIRSMGVEEFLALSFKEEEVIKKLQPKAKDFEKFFKNPEGPIQNITKSNTQNKKEKDNTYTLEKCILHAASFLNKKGGNDKLKNINNEYKKLLDKETPPPNYPAEINESNKQAIISIAEDLKKQSEAKKKNNTQESKKEVTPTEKIMKFFDKIIKEIEYIREIKRIDSISEKKKEYIIQHALTVIGEYEREVSNATEDASTVMDKKTSILEESSKTAKNLRKKGLGHEPLSLDHNQLLKGLHTDILPAYQDYQSIHVIGTNSINAVPQTAIILNKVGESLLRLCCTKEASECFKKALFDIKEILATSNVINPRPKADQYKLDGMGITQPTAICIDMTKVLFGIDSYELKLSYNLVYSLLLLGELEEAYNKVQELLTKIDTNKLERYKKTIDSIASNALPLRGENKDFFIEKLNSENAELSATYMRVIEHIQSIKAPFVLYYPDDRETFDIFSSMFGSVAYVYYENRKYSEAIELYHEALKFAISEKGVGSILSNLARSYYQLGDKRQAEHYRNQAINTENLLDKFSMIMLKCDMELDKKNFEIDAEIESLKDLLEKRKVEFKELVGDRFWTYPLELSKLNLKRTSLKGSNYLVINRQIQEGLNLIKEFNRIHRFSHEISRFYYYACRALSNLITAKNPPLPSNADDILSKAENYFNMGNSSSTTSYLIQKSASQDLATAYSNYVVYTTALSFSKRIEILEKTKKLQEDNGIETHTTILNLGCEYHKHARFFYEHKRKNQAISTYEMAIKVLGTDTLNQGLSENGKAERLKVLAMSYEDLGDCKQDINSLEQAKTLYFKFLREYKTHPDSEIVKSYAKDTLNKIGGK